MRRDDREALIREAMEAYGLKPDEVLGVDVTAGEVTLVTIAAHRVRYRSGDRVQPLDDLRAGRALRVQAP